MTTVRSNSSRLRFTVILCGSLAGCASSAIVEDGTSPPWEAENNGELLDAGDLDVDEPTTPSKPDTTKPTTPATKPDAGTPSSKPDAGSTSTPDAGTTTRPDASTPSTPGKPDAGPSTAPDASIPSTPSKPDAGGPPPDATVPTNPNDGKSCKAASDCTQPCVPVGVFNCCSDQGTCGCTWAPGAYCL